MKRVTGIPLCRGVVLACSILACSAGPALAQNAGPNIETDTTDQEPSASGMTVHLGLSAGLLPTLTTTFALRSTALFGERWGLDGAFGLGRTRDSEWYSGSTVGPVFVLRGDCQTGCLMLKGAVSFVSHIRERPFYSGGMVVMAGPFRVDWMLHEWEIPDSAGAVIVVPHCEVGIKIGGRVRRRGKGG